MFRPASVALLLLLAVPAERALAQDHSTAPPDTYIAPLQSNTVAPTTLAAPATPSPPAPAPPAPELKAVGGPDACADALRREDAAHQQAAAASQTMPAPLVLPPECSGSVRPTAGK